MTEPTTIRGNSDNEIIARVKKQIIADGRYILGINRKNGSGHVVSLEKVNGHIIIKDEQDNSFSKLESIDNISYLEVLRIDKSVLNIDLVKSILNI